MKPTRIFLFLLTVFCSCGHRNPDWIKGEWSEKHTNNKDTYTSWKFTNYQIYSKTNKIEYRQCQSTFVITFTPIEYRDIYVLKWENATDLAAYYEIFQKVNRNQILYHDSINDQVGKKVELDRLK